MYLSYRTYDQIVNVRALHGMHKCQLQHTRVCCKEGVLKLPYSQTQHNNTNITSASLNYTCVQTI